jgi:hypothetical protein
MDENLTQAELAASNVVEACVAVRAAGRSYAAVTAAMVALAEHPEIDPTTQEGAHFVVGAAVGYDKGRMNVVAQVTAFLERPECRGRLDLATKLIIEHNHNYELISSILLNIPRQSALEARMAAASAEPTVGAPFGAAPDPSAGWRRAVDAANRKKALN